MRGRKNLLGNTGGDKREQVGPGVNNSMQTTPAELGMKRRRGGDTTGYKDARIIRRDKSE